MNLNSKLNEALEEFFSFFSEVQLIHPHLTTPSINTASKFLYARKLNSKRAFDLYIAHQNVRSKENLLNIDPWNIEVKRELLTRKLTILSESDAEGSGVVLFTCRLHQPQISNHNSLLKAFVFQLDAALENLETQKKGLVFIYDMTNSKYNNFDLDLSIKILKLLKGSYPARLKKVLIISAPLWFKAPFKILNPFLLEKLKNRVYTILPSDLPIHLPIKTIPYHMGGQLKHSHIAWVKKCLSIYLSSSLSSSSSSPASKRFHPSNPHPSHNDEKKEEKERKIKEKIEAYFPAEDFQTSTSEHLQYYYEGVPSISNSSTFYTHNINVTSANNNHISNNHNNNKDINRKFQINEDYADFINFQPSDLSNFHSISCNNTNQNNNNNNQNDKKNHNNNLNNVNSSDDISSTETSNKDDRKHKIGSGEESVHQSDKEPHKESSTDDSVKKPRNCGKIASSEESKDDEKLGSYNFDDLKAPSDLLEYSGKAGRHVSELEYYKLRNLPVEGTFNTSKLKGNQDKNRYHDVMCLDQTRVKINQSDPDPPTSNLTTTNDQPNLPTNNNSDYINANYIDGFKSKRQYISTQGPMKNTIGDFWKMVWQEKVLVIVMTTRTTERERTKCEKYWPDDESTVLQHNNIAIIHCDQEQHLHSITTTTLLLQHLNTCETREVKHIHFTGWPDYGVPDDADDFLYLLRYVRQVKRAQWRKFKKENNHLYKVLLDTPSIDATLSSEVVFNGLHAEVDGEQDDKLDLSPVLVHCSAGIGRTGTFLAVDILIDVLNERGKINVYETIRRIREQRPYSIQMPEQYTFVYHAIIQYARQQGMM